MRNFLLYISAIFLIFFFNSCTENYTRVDNVKSVHFVGSQSCMECHQNEHELWKGSHHERAMDTAIAATVKGDFNNAIFKDENGFESKFYKRDNRFYVYTKAEDGIAKEMEISYVFGITPLQQYLIETGDGRLQCLPIAWDDQSDSYYTMLETVYHGQKIEADDWLYWTNNGQNWNSMCAECHTTNYHKGYNSSNNSFASNYFEINVGCESCHGPGSAHNEWASLPKAKREKNINYALTNVTSSMDAQDYINQCGYCHSRRTSYGDWDHKEDYYLNHWSPQLMHEDVYYSDGQILDEDYVVGSFMQSKMFRHGVKCSDCHDVHSQKTKFKGNQLCYQCHSPVDYEEKHHFHKKKNINAPISANGFYDNHKGDGTQCVDCHMDGANFMGVDFRRDHSLRVPRPDLSIRNGTPNACTSCHKDKSNQWAVDAIEKWYDDPFNHENTDMYNAFADARKGDESSIQRLIDDVVNQDSINNIYKASAIGYLGRFNSDIAQKTIEDNLRNKDALIRQSAVNQYQASDEIRFKKYLSKMLNDSVTSVRLAVINKVSLFPNIQFDPRFESVYQKSLKEYVDAMEHTSDFAASNYNLANISIKHGDDLKAIDYFKKSLKIDNRFYPSSLSLAIILSRNSRVEEAQNVLEEACRLNPELPDAFYYLGLIYAEQNNINEAINSLETSYNLSPINSTRLSYNLSLLYQKINNYEGALKYIEYAITADPNNELFAYSKIILNYNFGKRDNLKTDIDNFIAKYPNSQYNSTLRSIK